jgi:hypothetical protein
MTILIIRKRRREETYITSYPQANYLNRNIIHKNRAAYYMIDLNNRSCRWSQQSSIRNHSDSKHPVHYYNLLCLERFQLSLPSWPVLPYIQSVLAESHGAIKRGPVWCHELRRRLKQQVTPRIVEKRQRKAVVGRICQDTVLNASKHRVAQDLFTKKRRNYNCLNIHDHLARKLR